MHKTKKTGRTRRRLMTGLCCLGLFVSELSTVVPVWAMEPAVAEQTQDADSDGSDDTQISDGSNDGNQPQNPGGEEGDGNGTQNPGEEGGENGGETPGGSDEGNQPQNPGGEEGDGNGTQNPGEEGGENGGETPGGSDEGNQPQNPGGENDENGEQTPGEGNEEAQEPGGEEVSEDRAEETIPKEETAADPENTDATVYSDAANKLSWSIDSSGCLTITGTGDYEVDDNGNPAWWERREEVLSAVVDVTGITSTSKMFYGCSKMRQIDLSKLDTGKVTDMSDMFSGCKALSDLDLGSFDTGNVTNMSGMFSYCSSNSLDISGFDTGNVTDMSRMFFGSSMNADVSHFNTGNVTNMSYMFMMCDRLTKLDLSNFDTKNVTNMNGMFSQCEILNGVDVSSFDTKKVTNMSYMFMMCDRLTKLDLSNFDIGSQTNVEAMISYCDSLASVSVPKNLPENIEISLPVKSDDNWYDEEHNIYTKLPTGLPESITLYKNAFVDDGSGTWKMVLQISGITIESKTYDGEPLAYTGTAVAKDMRGNEIADVIINQRYEIVKRINQEEVTEVIAEAPDQAGSYRLVFSVEENDKYTAERVYSFDIKKKRLAVTAPTVSIEVGEVLPSIDEMTYTAEGLLGDDTFITEPKLKYEKEDISTDVSGSYKIIPYGADAGNNYSIVYKNGTLSVEESVEKGTTNNIRWRLNKAGVLRITGTGDYETDADGKPPWCNIHGVKSVLVNVSDITSTRNMFHGLGAASSIDLSGLDTSKVTDMSGMFQGCHIDGEWDLKSLDTSNVTDMSAMFRDSRINYPYENTLDLSGFDTSKVTNMREMFRNSRFYNVDLSSFNTENVTDMSGMFCEFGLLYDEVGRLKLDLRSFRTDKVEDMSYMFYNCRGIDLENLNVFHTGSVKNMSYMFASDDFVSGTSYRLTEADVSGFDTGNVTDMSHMFEYSYVEQVDLHGRDMGNVTDMSYMFASSRIKKVDMSGCAAGKVTNMRYMFYNAGKPGNLDVDLSGFSAGSVENMSHMFAHSAVPRLDLSGFDFSNVTDMTDTFVAPAAFGLGYYNNSLTELNLGNFNISKITTTSHMFKGATLLTSVTIADADTGNVRDMSEMFEDCSNLESLNLSGFDTAKVKNMRSMFSGCTYLESLDISGFDTTAVTDMYNMFYGCYFLEDLDLSGFHTSNVETMRAMFYGCGSLKCLDLSSFDMKNVTTADGSSDKAGMLGACYDLEMIFTPRNVSADVKALLPGLEPWYQMVGGSAKEITMLPRGLNRSILITRGKAPEVQGDLGGIVAVKRKTAYVCGETINTDDLTVAYCGADGSIEKLAENQYTTNAEQIDVTTAGERKLVVTCAKGGKELQAEITLKITYELTDENTTITLPSETDYDYTYNGQLKEPVPTVSYQRAGDTAAEVTLKEEEDYQVIYFSNIDAWEGSTEWAGAPRVRIVGRGDYSGWVSKRFNIYRADAPTPQTKNITAAQCTAAQENRTADLSGSFASCGEKTGYAVTKVEDEKGIFSRMPVTGDIRDGVLTYSTNAAKEGDTASIKVRVSFANYEDAELTVKITMSDEGAAYAVTFDGMGHCDSFTKGGVRAGSLLELTDSERTPVAEGYVFAGWYKDKGFAQNQEWNFDTDTVQSDLTLYACWLTGAAQDGNGMKLCVQEIPDLTYTGSAQKPAVTVYDSDGTTRLQAGKDYTVKYFNNINAVAVGADGKPTAVGGTARVTAFGKPDREKITNVSGTFTKDIPYVAITGKGNYAETVCRNFLILPAQIADGTTAGAAGDTADTPLATGFMLKYTDQLVVNQTKEQKPFGSMKYKKGMKAGTDYTVSLEADEAMDEKGSAVPAEWRADGTQRGKQYILPAIPKGYSGSFILTVTGENNYTGTIRRRVYVAEKQKLMKNVSITLGKNQKARPYTGEDVELSPGYYDTVTKKNYKVPQEGTVSSAPETNTNDMFLVKAGRESLVWGRDYIIDYGDTNRAVGTATMTLTGKGGYVGTKSVTFKITGTPFNAKTVEVQAYDEARPDGWKVSMPYTGRALTQNKVTLMTRATESDPTTKKLSYGEHYTISYKNNVKKGTATMTFTAKPESGYSGSFQKNFKITAQELTEDSLTVETSARSGGSYTAPYSKNGAKLSFTVTDRTGKALREGTDYTVKYKNNSAVTTDQTPDSQKPLMTVNGKGNYAGKVEVSFQVVQASLASALDNGTVQISCAQVQKKDGMKFTDFKFKLMEGKKRLGVGETKDYVIDETDCTPEKIKAYAEAVEAGTALPQEPSVKITGRGGYKEEEKNIPLGQYIYAEKLTAACVYVVVSEGAGQNIYTGAQVTPDVAVYYGDKTAVSAARKAGEKNETELTSASGAYKLKKLMPDKEYTRNYGANAAAGKNRGSVTVTGAGRYGGSVTVKFPIERKTL